VYAAQVNGKLQAGDVAGAQKASRRAQMWCWISVVCVTVPLILMTLAIPEMQKVIKRANETSAIVSLRDLNVQEALYNSTYPAHGFACTLSQLKAARLIPDDLASGVKAGYTFTITCGSKTTVNNVDQYNSYIITAVPNAVGRTGDRGFCTDGNEFRYDPHGGTNCTELLQ